MSVAIGVRGGGNGSGAFPVGGIEAFPLDDSSVGFAPPDDGGVSGFVELTVNRTHEQRMMRRQTIHSYQF